MVSEIDQKGRMTMSDRFMPIPNGDPELIPSHHGEECQGNGRHPGIPCCCDNCDHFLTCFPDWRDWVEEKMSQLDMYIQMDEVTLDSYLTPEEHAVAERIGVNVWDDLRGAETGKSWKEREAELRRMGDVDQIIANCVANQAMEGLICTEEDKAAVRRIVSGETTAADEVAKVLEKYRKH